MHISDWSSYVCSSDLGLALEFDRDRLALDRAVGTWRPGLGQGEQRQRARRQQFDLGLAELPAAAEIGEGVVVHVDQAPARTLGLRPVVGRSEERRVGQECVSTCSSRGETNL